MRPCGLEVDSRVPIPPRQAMPARTVPVVQPGVAGLGGDKRPPHGARRVGGGRSLDPRPEGAAGEGHLDPQPAATLHSACPLGSGCQSRAPPDVRPPAPRPGRSAPARAACPVRSGEATRPALLLPHWAGPGRAGSRAPRPLPGPPRLLCRNPACNLGRTPSPDPSPLRLPRRWWRGLRSRYGGGCSGRNGARGGAKGGAERSGADGGGADPPRPGRAGPFELRPCSPPGHRPGPRTPQWPALRARLPLTFLRCAPRCPPRKRVPGANADTTWGARVRPNAEWRVADVCARCACTRTRVSTALSRSLCWTPPARRGRLAFRDEGGCSFGSLRWGPWRQRRTGFLCHCLDAKPSLSSPPQSRELMQWGHQGLPDILRGAWTGWKTWRSRQHGHVVATQLPAPDTMFPAPRTSRRWPLGKSSQFMLPVIGVLPSPISSC